ncbi:glycosyltransferase family 2 protein [Candidatus Falkowbacteria bacterium]|nr:glycosyltransferase family 2 protein [Candidatus Falkowbacteria bacterium]
MVKVAIILINYKDYAQRFLQDCVASLRKVKFPSGEFKIFIVDNETTEQTRKTIAAIAPEAVIVPCETNFGYAGGNNLGMREAEKWGADYFCLLNMDTEVDENFLEEMLKVYQSDLKIGLVQSRLMLFENKEKINSMGNRLHFLGFGYCEKYQEKFQSSNIKYQINDKNQISNVQEIIYPSGAAVLISAEKLKQIGYFIDELFMYLEDAEWGWKSQLFGFRNVLAINSIVYHKYEFSRSAAKFYWIERNRQIVPLMCYHWLTLMLLFPAWLAMEIGMLLISLRGNWFFAKINTYKWFLNLNNIKKLLKWREAVQTRRCQPDWLVVRDFAGKIEYQETDNGLLTRFGNAVLNVYWQIAKKVIIW